MEKTDNDQKKSTFYEKEQEILNFWQENKVFEKSLEKGKKGDFSFYDGPPFANGLPHYGHIVASVIKDVIPRFKTMQGYNVRRKWGWDCHGLPVENEVEQELGLNGKKEIEEKYSVYEFNEYCRKSVMKYADQWRKFIPMIGRWVDMQDDYKTMDINYMESVWWVFKELWKKGFIYEGYKSMHICPHCGTTLSNFEVAQGYKDIKDISVTAKFELIDEPGTFVLAWTTTPWTLPGNVALAIGDNIHYIKVRSGNENYILAKDRFEVYKDNFTSTSIIEEFKGKELIGKSYKSLFDYFMDKNLENYENIYKIYDAKFVTIEDGTGIVHIAPAFGEDDMNLGREKKLPFIQHVDAQGKFTSDVIDFAGQYVKSKEYHQQADVEVLKYLANKNLIFSKETYEHSYPHCWRCDTPLLNYATKSWFVEVTKFKKDLINANKHTNWIPDSFKEGRFGKWLEGARDWSISRQRYWGAPIPVWKCECGEIFVCGSKKELEDASLCEVNDLHKHFIDDIELDCKKCNKKMKRVGDVLDCWFESGSMPYASIHYPFENENYFKNNFPADFIAEGQDQTRGWFYTLMVLSTALYKKPAFKNVVVNGMVLAEDGKKMSKRLKNYPEPVDLIKKYGADVLRFYLLGSQAVKSGDLCFCEKDLSGVYARYFITLTNVVSFYNMYKKESDTDFQESDNLLDKWIVLELHELQNQITENLEKYEIKKCIDLISEFILELSTWYLRRSRDRFKDGDVLAAKTLNYVLKEFVISVAPFIPFSAEYIYKEVYGESESVHLLNWPEKHKFNKEDNKILEEMNLSRKVVEKIHNLRDQNQIKVRQALSFASYNIGNRELHDKFLEIIANEVNVKTVKFDKNLKDGDVYLNIEITKELKDDGDLRELVRNINSLRKQANLTIKDFVTISIKSLNTNFVQLIKENLENLKKDVLASDIVFDSIEDSIISKNVKVNEFDVEISLK
ncbi:MAG TPA: isoleucine--tRNA ligase [bacterium]|nr:isoleucine--tRNA ligase [bacterium]